MPMRLAAAAVLACTLASALALGAQSGQAIDEKYTELIKEYLQDPRITTELVDHLPASETVPSPLEFLGRAVGAPGELTYAQDIHRYYQALATASPRARFWTIGKTEEGRDIVALAIADEATIASLDSHRATLDALTDPRRTSDAEAQKLLETGKPIYYLVSGMHSPENGGPEMLIELAFRLIVEETPFIQNIRRNVITLITPVIEVDGREKQVDTYYFNKKRAQGDARLPLMYWGKYVQHDNNRDGMGQLLELTRAITRVTLTWHPTILHDLHEAQTYLYSSTGTGPYNDALDPITVSEWWMLAQNDVLEMTKRSVPGVWTYGFYDGWVPNYMIFVAHSHNATGRFYEVQGYGPEPYDVRPGATQLSKEWFRPNPPLPFIRWGPRNNTNIQQSAVLFSLQHVAQNRRMYLENYWLKNKRAIEEGVKGPVHGWVVPAGQRRKADVAIAMNDLRRQGLEISRATETFRAGGVDVRAGDFIVRGDQPFRTLAEMYFSVQNYAPQNPSPYDDTGWTFQLMRDVRILPVTDKALLSQKMTLVGDDIKAPGGVDGSGPVLVVEHTADTSLATFRFRNAGVRMLATEEDFELAGRKFRAGIDRDPGGRPRDARPIARGARTLGPGGARGAKGQDARARRAADWLRPQLDPDPGRGLVARRARRLRRAVHILRRSEVARRQPAGEVRRDPVPARRRFVGVAGKWDGADGEGAASLQEDRRDAEPGVPRLERRHPRWDGARRSRGAGEVRAGRRHAHHRGLDGRDLPGLRTGCGCDSGTTGAALRPRFDSARPPGRSPQSDRVRLRRIRRPDLLQPGARAERRGNWRPGGGAATESERRARSDHHAERCAAADFTV